MQKQIKWVSYITPTTLFTANSAEGGLMLPLSQMQVTYHKPAKYNDKLFIETSLNYIKGARIEFAYTILNSDSQTLVTATTTLVFVNKKTGRPTRCPDDILEVLS